MGATQAEIEKGRRERFEEAAARQVQVQRLVMHPEEVIEMLNRLKDRPGCGATLLKPGHWTVLYAVEKGLLTVGNELCGPLRVKTGEKHAALTEEGRSLVSA